MCLGCLLKNSLWRPRLRRVAENGEGEGPERYVVTENKRKVTVTVGAHRALLQRLKQLRRQQDATTAQRRSGDAGGDTGVPAAVAALLDIIIAAEDVAVEESKRNKTGVETAETASAKAQQASHTSHRHMLDGDTGAAASCAAAAADVGTRTTRRHAAKVAPQHTLAAAPSAASENAQRRSRPLLSAAKRGASAWPTSAPAGKQPLLIRPIAKRARRQADDDDDAASLASTATDTDGEAASYFANLVEPAWEAPSERSSASSERSSASALLLAQLSKVWAQQAVFDKMRAKREEEWAKREEEREKLEEERAIKREEEREKREEEWEKRREEMHRAHQQLMKELRQQCAVILQLVQARFGVTSASTEEGPATRTLHGVLPACGARRHCSSTLAFAAWPYCGGPAGGPRLTRRPPAREARD